MGMRKKLLYFFNKNSTKNKMKQNVFTGAKMFEVPITHQGKNYFPELIDITQKNIRAIEICGNITPLSGKNIVETENLYLSVTEDGQTYFLENMSAKRFDEDYNRGNVFDINKKLSLRDCYINNQGEGTGVAVVVIWYDAPNFVEPHNGVQFTEMQEIELIVGSALENRFPDVPYLHGASYNKIATFDSINYAPSGTATADNTIFKAAYITIQRGTQMLFENVPIALLKTDYMYCEKYLKNVVFDFDNSYIRIAKNQDTEDFVGKKILLQLTYIK
jgi:hypothetical protein